MTRDTAITRVMTTGVVTIAFDATIHEALDAMIANRVTCLPVISSSKTCIGILSLTDLMQVASDSEHLINDVSEDVFDRMWVVDVVRSQFGNEQVHVCMSDPPIRIGCDASINEAADLMLKHGVHHLPVIDSDEKLRGLVSTMDVLKHVRYPEVGIKIELLSCRGLQ